MAALFVWNQISTASYIEFILHFSLTSRGPGGGPSSLAHNKNIKKTFPPEHIALLIVSNQNWNQQATTPFPHASAGYSLSSRWRCGFKAAMKTAPPLQVRRATAGYPLQTHPCNPGQNRTDGKHRWVMTDIRKTQVWIFITTQNCSQDGSGGVGGGGTVKWNEL